MTAAGGLDEALTDLAGALRSTSLRLDVGEAEPARRSRTELADQIGDYLLPRLRRLDAPLLVVIGGSTGAGKSTVTNTIVGRTVSPAGVLRPTTRSPVLICHPDDQPWFAGDEVLSGLPRLTGSLVEPDRADEGEKGDDASAETRSPPAVIRLVQEPAIGPGLALLDAPDIDSVEEANRELATQLLAAADLWLFSTTAMRYADAVPWDFLTQARDRGTALAVIINRIPPGASTEIVPHLESMLSEHGLADVAVHPIEQAELTTDGLLPAAAVADIDRLLKDLSADADRRAAVVRSTLEGALSSIGPRAMTVIEGVRAQNEAVAALGLETEQAYRGAVDQIETDIGSGNLLRGEVLERWQELVGTAELMQAIQSRISLLRDRLGSFLSGRPRATADVQGEITSTLERLLIDHADGAASLTADRWRNLPGGRQVLGDDRSLERASEQFRTSVAAEVRAWQDDILELVRERGAGKRAVARVLAFGINTVGIALMLVLFSQTAGLSGGEIAIGAGTAGVSQTLLSALFGEQAVRELAAEARRLLLERVEALLQADAGRFRSRLDEIRSTVDAEALQHAMNAVERAR